MEVKINPDSELARFLVGVEAIVEANRFEYMCLWDEWHNNKGKPWASNLSGMGQSIGKTDGMTTFLSLFRSKVNGVEVLFVEPTSQVVDYRLIDEWKRVNFPELRMVDADNFYRVFQPAKGD